MPLPPKKSKKIHNRRCAVNNSPPTMDPDVYTRLDSELACLLDKIDSMAASRAHHFSLETVVEDDGGYSPRSFSLSPVSEGWASVPAPPQERKSTPEQVEPPSAADFMMAYNIDPMPLRILQQNPTPRGKRKPDVRSLGLPPGQAMPPKVVHSKETKGWSYKPERTRYWWRNNNETALREQPSVKDRPMVF
eukprot:TRINITY_DN5018_c0_g1_i1.p1 TRINITY_DN5018_c0_g1~~TRINITY_DN5018_c0_g1_i1.p1  ORF type:complete len:191 (+),score=23.83 TRINITY_DN5018_c0_g1_i1:16-588(+)